MARDFYLSAYSSPLALDTIRKNDAHRAKEVYCEYRPDWGETEHAEAEILVSGIEHATLMPAGDLVPLETRIRGALQNILGIYGIPPEIREEKINRVMAMDYRKIGRKGLKEFKKYIEEENKKAFFELLNG